MRKQTGILVVVSLALLAVGCGKKKIRESSLDDAPVKSLDNADAEEGDLGFTPGVVIVKLNDTAYPHDAECRVAYTEAGAEQVSSFNKDLTCEVGHFDGKKSSCKIKAGKKTCQFKVRAEIKKGKVQLSNIDLKVKAITPPNSDDGTFAYDPLFPRYFCGRSRCIIEHKFILTPNDSGSESDTEEEEETNEEESNEEESANDGSGDDLTDGSSGGDGGAGSEKDKYDLDGDGLVGFSDKAIFDAHFGSEVDPSNPESVRCDFNGDGTVNFGDLALFTEFFGT